MSARCRWCHGLGMVCVEPGSTLRYRCPDCTGTGTLLSKDELESERAQDRRDDLAAEEEAKP